jgi:Plant ATP synthase F0
MPQLDKISFFTQYFWLTLFFFGLYFLTVNFFVILVFKNLKLRNIIYRIWYFFLYKFDYLEYSAKNKLLKRTYFSKVYNYLLSGVLSTLKFLVAYGIFDSILNRSLLLSSFERSVLENVFKSALFEKSYSLDSSLLSKLNNLDIDEI